MKRKKKDNKAIDDGRVIAPMNVEGMPWYTPSDTKNAENEQIPLTKRENKQLFASVFLASLVIGMVFVALITVFILFCVLVWFK